MTPRPTLSGPRGAMGLVFMVVWLTLWTVGVALLCAIVPGNLVTQPEGAVPRVFLLTHGGAEVVVLLALARGLVERAGRPRSPDRIDVSLDGVTATWRRDGVDLALAAGFGLFGGVVHLVLLGASLAGLLVGPNLVEVGARLVLGGFWLTTAAFWAHATLTLLRSAMPHTLVATPREVVYRGGEGALGFRLPAACVEPQLTGDTLVLTSDVAIDVGEAPERADLVEVLTRIGKTARQQQADAGPAPRALRAMLERQRTTG